MRKFTLTNAIGQTWDLNNIESFFHQPKGLGGERKITYAQIGNRFAETDEKLKQKSISGKIAFSGYREYSKFAKFIQHRPLTLTYEIPDGRYSMKVNVTKLTKTELETMGIVSDVVMEGLTTWYRQKFTENTVSKSGGKIYPYTYAYTYLDATAGTLEFESESTEESPIRLVILGPCTNPSWIHRVNGVVVATGKVNETIGESMKLVVDTTSNPYKICEIGANGEETRDLYEKSDFSTERFLTAGYGRNVISAMHEGSEDIKIALEVQEEYAAI